MKILSFDCESAGLLGDTFAVGFVVHLDGEEIECGWLSIGVEKVWEHCASSDRKWLVSNTPPEILFPQEHEPHYAATSDGMERWFKRVVEKHSDALIVCDCGFPVEEKFLRACEIFPYPLHEVATALLMDGRDPTGTFERREDELPKHHPMMDARQSCRVFLEALNRKEN